MTTRNEEILKAAHELEYPENVPYFVNGAEWADKHPSKESLRPQNVCSYNPYKIVVESIAEMCKHYDKATDLHDFYDNVKVKCKDAEEYDSLFPQSQWKPSEEQIKSLAWLVEYGNTSQINMLRELLEQLKAL